MFKGRELCKIVTNVNMLWSFYLSTFLQQNPAIDSSPVAARFTRRRSLILIKSLFVQQRPTQKRKTYLCAILSKNV